MPRAVYTIAASGAIRPGVLRQERFAPWRKHNHGTTARCDSRIIKVVDGNRSVTFPFDSLHEVEAVNNGALLSSTLTLKRLIGPSTLQDYDFTGTGNECSGIAEKARLCMIELNDGAYTDWVYP